MNTKYTDIIINIIIGCLLYLGIRLLGVSPIEIIIGVLITIVSYCLFCVYHMIRAAILYRRDSDVLNRQAESKRDKG
jgi:hypothetical protein